MTEHCINCFTGIAPCEKQSSGGGGEGGTIPFATACGMRFFGCSWSIHGDTGSSRRSADLL